MQKKQNSKQSEARSETEEAVETCTDSDLRGRDSIPSCDEETKTKKKRIGSADE